MANSSSFVPVAPNPLPQDTSLPLPRPFPISIDGTSGHKACMNVVFQETKMRENVTVGLKKVTH